MTVMEQNATEPEITEGEVWYDSEIAPVLADLAKRCSEKGMAFVSVVEYRPGSHAGTYLLGENAGLSLQMIGLCARTAPNIDSYVMQLARYCRSKGINIDASFVMKTVL